MSCNAGRLPYHTVTALNKESSMPDTELLPIAISDVEQNITISYRGKLAEKVSAINCTRQRNAFFNSLMNRQFDGCLCFWDEEKRLVIGRIEDVGSFFPYW